MQAAYYFYMVSETRDDLSWLAQTQLIGWEPGELDPHTGLTPLKTKWDYGEFVVTLDSVIGLDYGVGITHLELDAESVTSGIMQAVKVGSLRDHIAQLIRLTPALIYEEVALADILEHIERFGLDVIEITLSDTEKLVYKEMTTQAIESTKTAADEIRLRAKRLRGTPPSRGRGAKTPESWSREIAELYLDMLKAEGPRGVVQAMAVELDAPANTVSQWVRKSRLEGWLGPAPLPGKAGGVAGTRLIKWRKNKEEEEE